MSVEPEIGPVGWVWDWGRGGSRWPEGAILHIFLPTDGGEDRVI